MRRLEGMAKELSAGQNWDDLSDAFLNQQRTRTQRKFDFRINIWLNMAIIFWRILCFWKVRKRHLKELKSEAMDSYKFNVNSALSWLLDRMESISYTFCKSFLCLCSIQVHEVLKKGEPLKGTKILGHRALFCR